MYRLPFPDIGKAGIFVDIVFNRINNLIADTDAKEVFLDNMYTDFIIRKAVRDSRFGSGKLGAGKHKIGKSKNQYSTIYKKNDGEADSLIAQKFILAPPLEPAMASRRRLVRLSEEVI